VTRVAADDGVLGELGDKKWAELQVELTEIRAELARTDDDATKEMLQRRLSETRGLLTEIEAGWSESSSNGNGTANHLRTDDDYDEHDAVDDQDGDDEHDDVDVHDGDDHGVDDQEGDDHGVDDQDGEGATDAGTDVQDRSGMSVDELLDELFGDHDETRRASAAPDPDDADDPLAQLRQTGPIPHLHTGPVPVRPTGPPPRRPTGNVPRQPSAFVPGRPPAFVPGRPPAFVPGRHTGPVPHPHTGPVPHPHTGPVPGPQPAPALHHRAGPVPAVVPPASGRRSPNLVRLLGAFAAAATVGLAAFVLLSQRGGDDAATTAAVAVDPAHEVEELEEILGIIGLHDLQPDLDGSIIRLTGTVANEAQLQSARDAAAALADEIEVDTSRIIIAGPASGPSESATSAGAEPPEPTLQRDLTRLLMATPVVFEPGESELDELERRILNNIAAVLLAYSNALVSVVGYGDDGTVGTELGEARAEIVRIYLSFQGVPGDMLRSVGRAGARPDSSSSDIALEVSVG
jgi:outer membrane protein OmpA-like peptidoglycan-associated protein